MADDLPSPPGPPGDQPPTPDWGAAPPPGTPPPSPGTTPPPPTPPPAGAAPQPYPLAPPPANVTPPYQAAPPGQWQGTTAPPAYGYPMAGRPNAPGAVAALVCGLVGIFACPFVGIAGIVMGNKAKKEIRDSGGYYDGEGLATAGLVLGWISIALLVLWAVILVILLATGAFVSTTNY